MFSLLPTIETTHRDVILNKQTVKKLNLWGKRVVDKSASMKPW